MISVDDSLSGGFCRSRQFAASPSRGFLPRHSLLCRPLCRCVITGNYRAYCSLSTVGNFKKECDLPSWLVSGSENPAALGGKCSVGVEFFFCFFFISTRSTKQFSEIACGGPAVL